MRLDLDNDKKRSKAKRYAAYALILAAIIIFNLTYLEFLSVGGLSPDFALILVVWIAISEGRMEGLLAGFAAGLLLDYFSMDILGANALSKATAGFVAGLFYKENLENQILGGYKIFTVVFLSSAAHNLIYFLLYVKYSSFSFLDFFLKYGLALSFYTTVWAAIPFLFRLPKNKLIR